MGYQWDPELASGHQKIDNQHKQLIAALNDIALASEQGKGSDEIFRTLEFLTGYTIMHFSDEEKLMEKYMYPDFFSHRGRHEAFKITVGELTAKLRNEGPTPALVGEVSETIKDWLINHIKSDDFRMAAFVRSVET